MTRIKICGVNDPVAFDAAIEAGADYVGFVFFAASPRSVTLARAAELSARHPGGPLRVGLFVKPGDDEIAAALAAVKLDVLQLYAPAARVAALRERFGVPVWRAVGIAAAADLPHAAAGADGLLIEAKPPEGATRPGGNAVSFDWSLLSGWHAPSPWVLGGGLTPDNVAAAIRATHAPTVDVSSGVERARGVKDPALIRAFVAAARAA
ncbi:phosphoribosylanthranilate isomerase [Limobrevibacterium gyesilva]|uniref:N-(5'-phosphoribosyl)anthranilate isomerase n=1 Tax=Limobrevibacterium gyesilva TaxID=2991712 RepID=A0AA41YVH4_9PROT|nr:phosphoribosylanthranilate isomerase [Limobrevibacterium gyesilva]MCW3477278.1 phosphoribosylanthranilate isomerase [Limobrevibacterium gyesilva]